MKPNLLQSDSRGGSDDEGCCGCCEGRGGLSFAALGATFTAGIALLVGSSPNDAGANNEGGPSCGIDAGSEKAESF